MKTSSPYGPGMTIKTSPETVTSELSKAGSKAKARYPHSPRPVNASSGGGGGKMKHRATPGADGQ